MDFTLYDNMAEWEKVVAVQMERIEQKRSNTFRKKGSINQDEFLSVAVEAFSKYPERKGKIFSTWFTNFAILGTNILQNERAPYLYKLI